MALSHYAIEFRTWCRTAERWIASGCGEPFGTGLHADPDRGKSSW